MVHRLHMIKCKNSQYLCYFSISFLSVYISKELVSKIYYAPSPIFTRKPMSSQSATTSSCSPPSFSPAPSNPHGAHLSHSLITSPPGPRNIPSKSNPSFSTVLHHTRWTAPTPQTHKLPLHRRGIASCGLPPRQYCPRGRDSPCGTRGILPPAPIPHYTVSAPLGLLLIPRQFSGEGGQCAERPLPILRQRSTHHRTRFLMPFHIQPPGGTAPVGPTLPSNYISSFPFFVLHRPPPELPPTRPD